MNSFISHFKPWLVALAAFLIIEGSYYAYANPAYMDRTNLLLFSFAKPELPQRLFTWHKMRDFGDQDWDIVQVGDSSGFHGIDPRLIDQYLPAGMKYVNMSCCANQGFVGYYNVLKFMLEHSHGVKYAVLHFTPYTMPRPEMWGDDGASLWGNSDIRVFGKEIGQEVNAPWKWLRVPTLAARQAITQDVFYQGEIYRKRDAPLLDNINYFHFRDLYKESKGWMAAPDAPVVVSSAECDLPTPSSFDWTALRETPLLQQVLEAYANLARSHGVKLVVVFQPVACTFGTGVKNKVARDVVEKFKRENPDVSIPFPLIETWDAPRFLVPAHVANQWVPETSKRLGLALAGIIKANQ